MRSLDRNFFLFAEIEQHAVEAVSDRSPFVLQDQPAMIDAESEIFVGQQMQLRDDRLKKCGDGDSVVNARRNIANAKFKRRK